MNGLRVDKWLWAARFFKTRALAVRACELGRIESNGNESKPSREVRVGDTLRIRNEAGLFEIEVLGLSGIRGPAAAAQALYRESEASRTARLKLAEEQKEMHRLGMLREGKPNRRERHELDRLRGRA